jgi:hypothetical protein
MGEGRGGGADFMSLGYTLHFTEQPRSWVEFNPAS